MKVLYPHLFVWVDENLLVTHDGCLTLQIYYFNFIPCASNVGCCPTFVLQVLPVVTSGFLGAIERPRKALRPHA